MKTKATLFALIAAIVSLRTDTIYASAVLGLIEHLKIMIANDIGWALLLIADSLYLTAQSPSGIRASFNPGVSIRLKCSNSTIFGSYVTDFTDLLA